MIDWREAAPAEPIRDREPRFDRPPASPVRERRAHARAYRYWNGLRGDRPQPRIDQLVPAELRSYAANSVLFELDDARLPAIRFLGRAIAEEADVPHDRPNAAVPAVGTLLAALAARLPLIAASGAPLDFEAEQPGRDGAWTLYRGVLLPITDPAGRGAYVYGVVTWKRIHVVVDDDVRAAIGEALGRSPAVPATSPWSRALGVEPLAPPAPRDADGSVATGRTWAALAGTEHVGRARSLHAALSACHDLAVATPGCPAAARDAAIAAVFGASATGAHAAVLERAARLGLGEGALAGVLDGRPGGVDDFLRALPPPAASPAEAYLRLDAVEPAALAAMPLPRRRRAVG